MEPEKYLAESSAAVARLHEHADTVRLLARRIVDNRHAGTVYACGNGGSMAAAQHLAAELSVRFRADRVGISALAVGADPVYFSAVKNDFSHTHSFYRQLHATLSPDDTVIIFTTSGKSINLRPVVDLCMTRGARCVLLAGPAGGDLARGCWDSILVDAPDSAIVQDCHSAITHALMFAVEGLL
jgi:D-sedoheptulose 7-phosphate isomerase